jgi:transcriptional regulator with XRE-family HTH domain
VRRIVATSPEAIADRIESRCRALHITQAEAGRRAGLSRQYLSRLKSGELKGYKHRLRLANALQCESGWLFSGETTAAWVSAASDGATTAARELLNASGVIERTHTPTMEQWERLSRARRALRAALKGMRK